MADDVLINLVVNGRNNAKGMMKDVIGGVDELKKATRDYTKEVNAKEKAEKESIQTSQMMGKTFDKQASQLSGWIEKLRAGNEKLNKVKSDGIVQDKAVIDSINKVGKSFKTLEGFISEYVDQANEALAENKKIKDGLKELRAGTKEYEEAVNGLAKALKVNVDVLKDEIKAFEKRKEAQKKQLDKEITEFLEREVKARIENTRALRAEATERVMAAGAAKKAKREEEEAAKASAKAWEITKKNWLEKQELRKQEVAAAMEQAKLNESLANREEELERRTAIRRRENIEVARENMRRERVESAKQFAKDVASSSGAGRSPFDNLRSSTVDRSQTSGHAGMLDGMKEVTEESRKIKKSVHEATQELSIFARTINKISGGRVSLDDKNDQFKNLRGLTSELRGFGIAFAIKNIQGLASAGVGAAGGLTSLAASAISAGGALGGALAAGAAQAIGPLAVLASTIGRITAITKVLNLKQQINEASTHTGQADAAGAAADSMAAAQDRVADSIRGTTQAQKDYNEAVREAKRNLQDMRLEQQRSNLQLEDAQRNLSSALLGNDTAAISVARLDLREAKLKAQRSGADNSRAQKGGVQGDPGVVAARERIADANKQAAQATRALAQAQKGLAASGDGATASQDRLSYMLGQLTTNERRLVDSIGNLQDVYKKAFRGVSDIIIGEIANSVDVVTKLFARPDIIKPFMENAKAGAAAIKQITSFLGSENTVEFFKVFTEQSTKNIPKLTTGLINLGKAFMNIADNSAGVFNVILDDAVKLTENIAKATANSGEFFSNSLKDYEAWKGLLTEIWGLFKVIFEPARAAGMEAITVWTKEIAKFVDKLNANPDAVSQFFKDGTYATNQILRVVWEIGKALYEVFKPESVKALADFLIQIVIPAFKQVVLTIGVVTHYVQQFLALPVISNLARWILTITLLSRAFAIMTTAVKNIGLALAGAASLLGGGAGFSNKLRAFVGIVILVSSALGAMGISLKDITEFFHEHTTAVTIATTALGGFMALLSANKIAGYITAVGELTKAFRALAASEGIAAAAGSVLGGRFTKTKGGPNMSGANLAGNTGGVTGIMGRVKGMSKMAKGAGIGALAAGVGAGVAGSAIGGKTGSWISNVGGGAATGAGIGMIAGLEGAAIGAVAGGLVGLGAMYLSTRKKQETFAQATKNSTDALRAQVDAIKAVADAKLDKKDTKLDYQQARIDYRSARGSVKQTYNQLKAEGMSDREIRQDDRYKQALITRERALNSLVRAQRAYRESNQKIKDSEKEAETATKKRTQTILKAIDAANRKVHDARDDYDNAKGNTKNQKELFGDKSTEYRRALAKEKKALENLKDANKDYRKELGKVPGAYANVNAAGKTLNKNFKGSKKAFEDVMRAIVAGTNGVLSGFNVKPLKFSVSDDGHTLIESENAAGDKNVSVDGAGYATGGFITKADGGWIGKPGQKGRDTVKTILGKGEAVLNHAQQRIVNGALQNSGIGGLDDVFQKTKGTYHYMAGGGFAGMAPGITKAAQTVLGKFPGLVLSSGRRNRGGTSYHESGRAADIAGSPALMRQAAQWIKTSSLAKKLAEGIHNPNLSIKNGQTVSPGFWGAQTWGGHADHIHIALGGALGKITGGIASEVKKLKAPKIGGKGPLKKILQSASKKLASAANKYIAKKAQTAMPDADSGVPSGAGAAAPPGKVRSWLKEALQITGHYNRSNLNALYGRAMQESGGNPKAINNWDSNAKAGTPSKGLLQTIDPTFNAHKMKGYNNIWNPVDNAIAAIRYMFSRYGHIVGRSNSGYASGGFVGSFAKGGAVPGNGVVPILAHSGEWILNKAQQTHAASAAGMTREELRNSLGFSGGPNSFAGGGIVPDYESSDKDYRTDYRAINKGHGGKKSTITKRIDKALKAIRDLTADNGVIAQFATVLEAFSTKLDNALKKASYAFDKVTGKGVKKLDDIGAARQGVENIEKAGAVQGAQIKKIQATRKKAVLVRSRAEGERNKADQDDLGDLYDNLDEREAAGKSTVAVTKAIKRRETKLKKSKSGRKKLKKLKGKQTRLRKTRKGVRSIDASLDAMEANQAELAQQAYDAQYNYIQTQSADSQDAFDIANTNADISMASSVSAGANAGIKNAALAQRNASLEPIINSLAALGGKDSEIAKLRQEQEQNRQEMERNTIATMVNTSQIKQSLVAFKSSIIGTGINIFKALGALTGTTDNAAITGALTKNGANLTGNRTDIIGSLNTFLQRKGMAGIDPSLSGGALASSLIGLSGTNTLGWTPEEQDAFQGWLSALGDNELAIIDNTQQLKDLNGNNDQGFSSYSWTAFRSAVFDGTGGLMPNVKDLVPHAAVGADVVSDGLAYVHAAEVILNKNDAKTWKGAANGDVHVNITTPQEVADPVAIGNKIMFELNNRGK